MSQQLYARALKAYEKKDYKKAIEFLQTYLLKDPHGQSFFLMGLVMYETGNVKKATNCFHRALTLNFIDRAVFSYLGKSLCDIGQVENGIEVYREGLKHFPDDSEMHSNLIFSMDLSGQYSMKELFEERQHFDKQHCEKFYPKQLDKRVSFPYDAYIA